MMIKGIVRFCLDNMIPTLIAIWIGWSIGQIVVLNKRLDLQTEDNEIQNRLIVRLYTMRDTDIKRFFEIPNEKPLRDTI